MIGVIFLVAGVGVFIGLIQASMILTAGAASARMQKISNLRFIQIVAKTKYGEIAPVFNWSFKLTMYGAAILVLVTIFSSTYGFFVGQTDKYPVSSVGYALMYYIMVFIVSSVHFAVLSHIQTENH